MLALGYEQTVQENALDAPGYADPSSSGLFGYIMEAYFC